MYFESFSAFLAMGHHGPYVWSAYGIALAMIVSNAWLAWRSVRTARLEIARQLRREAMRESS